MKEKSLKRILTRVFIISSIPIQYGILQILKTNPQWVQDYYTEGFYRIYFNIFNSVFSLIPFSLGDVFYILLVLLILRFVIRIFRKKIKLEWRILFKVISFVSFVYFLFHISWGINYYKVPMHEQLEIKNDYTTQQLITFAEELAEKTNKIHKTITADSLPVKFDKSTSYYKNLIFKDFDRIDFTPNSINHLSAKGSLISLPLTYMGFGGYLNPFTLEAQYNYKVPGYKLPTLIAHEMGHQLGYAKENEANFIGCFVNMNSENIEMKYAGYSYALRFCLNEIYRRSPEEFERLREKVNPGVLKNFNQITEFWESYENPMEPVFKTFYGNFLKVNNQPEGMKSYSYVVALLVNYYSENSLP